MVQKNMARKKKPALETPIDYMLRVMRTPNASVERRDEMAKLLAPYLHQKAGAGERPRPEEPVEPDPLRYLDEKPAG
jgi:hypothetical protein